MQLLLSLAQQPGYVELTIVSLSSTDLSVGIVEPLVVGLPEVNDVDVSLVDRLDVALGRVDPHGHGAVDAGHSDAVTRLNTVDLLRWNSPMKLRFIQRKNH